MPFPTSPMSFQLEVFRGGQTEGQGQEGCSGCRVWGLEQEDDSVDYNEACLENKPLGPQLLCRLAGPRNPFCRMKDPKGAGNLFLPMRPPESLHFQKRAHFISLQESGL